MEIGDRKTEKSTKSKVASLKRATKLTNFQLEKKTQITKIIKWRHCYQFYRNKKRIIREYQEHLYANKWDNLDEMEKFLETHIIPKFHRGEIENLNRRITSNETESVIKNLSIRKALDQRASLVNSIKHLKKD